MRYLILLSLILVTTNNSFSQSNKFDELKNQMFFNILIFKPDSVVFDFVKTYFPVFSKEPKPGKWSVYPPGPVPEFLYTVHSLEFKKHPYFDARFHEGRLDFLASEEKNGRPGRSLRGLRLWFMFDSEIDAKTAFAKLNEMFDTLSKSKNIYSVNGKTIAEYSDQPIFDKFNSVQIILTSDELYNNKFKIFFRIDGSAYPE